jgi:radical SAM protein with 4Fe4S-binding SPASM domain
VGTTNLKYTDGLSAAENAPASTSPEGALLKKHVEIEHRRTELRQIEKRLVEHPFPPQIVVETTSYCNLKCVHCSHREMIRPNQHMDREVFNKIVEEIGREHPKCEVWPTFYGEAFILGDELWDRLDYAAKVGCQNLVLNSNGTLLDRDDNIEKVLASPLRRFILSLDGLSKETFEHIRAKAKWETVYPAVEELCRRRIERGQQYPVLIAQFSVMKENVHEVEAYREYWKARGAEVKVRPMLEWTATGTVRSETISHVSDFRIACPWGNNTMAIHQDGSVVACAVDYEGMFKAGNVRDHTLKELWAILGEKLRKPHREHRWGDMPNICKGCGDWQVAGAQYEEEKVEGTRPFWYYDKSKSVVEP